jgi:hypothetical protein
MPMREKMALRRSSSECHLEISTRQKISHFNNLDCHGNPFIKPGGTRSTGLGLPSSTQGFPAAIEGQGASVASNYFIFVALPAGIG